MPISASEAPPVRPIQHEINDALCTGCEACISVCPTDVLRLKAHKSRVAYYERCIHCQKCDEVCPTGALVTFPIGEQPRSLNYPRLDPFFQSEQNPGIYLIGEAAGRPLIKNAVNMGRVAVAHMMSAEGGLRPGALSDGVDVLIIGAGPAGLSAALTCIEFGLSYRIVERLDRVASTIVSYPAGKSVMAEPMGLPCHGWLPVYDEKKERFVAAWEQLLRPFNLSIQFNEAVSTIRVPQRDGAMGSGALGRVRRFEVATQRGNVYRAQRVVIAIGARGKLRQHRAKGSGLPHIHHGLLNPEDFRRKHVMVVGGGDSAVESALLLADAELNNNVTLCVRGPNLLRVNSRNRARLDEAVASNLLRRFLRTEIKEFRESEAVIEKSGTPMTIKAEAVILQIGADPPVSWLATFGVDNQQGILFNKSLPHSYAPPEPHMLVTSLLGQQLDRSGPLETLPLQHRESSDEETPAITMRLPNPELLIRLPERDVPRWAFPRKG